MTGITAQPDIVTRLEDRARVSAAPGLPEEVLLEWKAAQEIRRLRRELEGMTQASITLQKLATDESARAWAAVDVAEAASDYITSNLSLIAFRRLKDALRKWVEHKSPTSPAA